MARDPSIAIAVAVQVEQRARKLRVGRVDNPCLEIRVKGHNARARTGDPHEFCHHPLGLLEVMEDAVGPASVEQLICEVERICIAHLVLDR